MSIPPKQLAKQQIAKAQSNVDDLHHWLQQLNVREQRVFRRDLFLYKTKTQLQL
jgi:DNA-directed RNA polymerase sigma subunit (sigma70/sigma32)